MPKKKKSVVDHLGRGLIRGAVYVAAKDIRVMPVASVETQEQLEAAIRSTRKLPPGNPFKVISHQPIRDGSVMYKIDCGAGESGFMSSMQVVSAGVALERKEKSKRRFARRRGRR